MPPQDPASNKPNPGSKRERFRPTARTGARRAIQGSLLAAYSALARSGLLSSGPARRAFEGLYLLYKQTLEAGSVRRLHPYVRPGSTVIDAGAHIGFFTLPLARWVGAEGRLLAVEPEERNFARLGARLERAGLAARVETIRGVLAERSGDFRVAINPLHPGDHRLAEEGTPVAGWSLDDLLAERPGPPVSFIKIDVQGAELRVIEGASEVLARDRPALLVEVEPPVIVEMGGTPEDLLAGLDERGYRGHLWVGGVLSGPLDNEALLAHAVARDHVDVLFLH